MNSDSKNMELEVVKFCNKNCRYLDGMTGVISYIPLLVVFWSAMTLFILLTNKDFGQDLAMAFAMSLAMHFFIIEPVLKRRLFFRNRPYIAHPGDISPIGQHLGDSSFPSSHIASLLAIATVYCYYYPSLWPVMLVLILLMAYARIHNGMHYPSDILAGAALGTAYGFFALYLVKILM